MEEGVVDRTSFVKGGFAGDVDADIGWSVFLFWRIGLASAHTKNCLYRRGALDLDPSLCRSHEVDSRI
jgi:hypothetical protein